MADPARRTGDEQTRVIDAGGSVERAEKVERGQVAVGIDEQ